jgi:tetratricopeptide (TPR) repeat protein
MQSLGLLPGRKKLRTLLVLAAFLSCWAASAQTANQPSADSLVEEAGKASKAGEYQTALALYVAAATADPRLYAAALGAGDAAYSLKDVKTAAAWFKRAITLDPDRETAYRYWGDVLLRAAGDAAGAKQKFIDAVVAEPYNQDAWHGLRQWAELEDAEIAPPFIDRPAIAIVAGDNPQSIHLTAAFGGVDARLHPNASAWSMYTMVRQSYRAAQFKADHPGETEYRHSLREEDAALSMVGRTASQTLAENKSGREKLDPSLRHLLELNEAGMLDCWILLNGADAGIERDYAAYRGEHRGLLHDYLELYVVRGGKP